MVSFIGYRLLIIFVSGLIQMDQLKSVVVIYVLRSSDIFIQLNVLEDFHLVNPTYVGKSSL